MKSESIDKQIQDNAEKIAAELKKGKDIIIKVTPKGLKVQAMQVNTII